MDDKSGDDDTGEVRWSWRRNESGRGRSRRTSAIAIDWRTVFEMTLMCRTADSVGTRPNQTDVHKQTSQLVVAIKYHTI